jgi:gamma-glutamyl:cysteine ligase YbdK (ATP-grasp superfamily)
MEHLERKIRETAETLKELDALVPILKANIGKKLTKRQLGKTPNTKSFGVFTSWYVYVGAGREGTEITFHDPVTEDDIKWAENRQADYRERIERMGKMRENQDRLKEERQAVIEAKEGFERRLEAFRRRAWEALDDENIFKEIFGGHRERMYAIAPF